MLVYLGASYFRNSHSCSNMAFRPAVWRWTRRSRRPKSATASSRFSRAGRDAVTVFALLESASLTGAYRFIWRGKGVWGDVEARLFLSRRGAARVAPLTSMYWFSKQWRWCSVFFFVQFVLLSRRSNIALRLGVAQWTLDGGWKGTVSAPSMHLAPRTVRHGVPTPT